jgi:hypothetical protein
MKKRVSLPPARGALPGNVGGGDEGSVEGRGRPWWPLGFHPSRLPGR